MEAYSSHSLRIHGKSIEHTFYAEYDLKRGRESPIHHQTFVNVYTVMLESQ